MKATIHGFVLGTLISSPALYVSYVYAEASTKLIHLTYKLNSIGLTNEIF